MSVWHHPSWKPTLADGAGQFSFRHLIEYVDAEWPQFRFKNEVMTPNTKKDEE